MKLEEYKLILKRLVFASTLYPVVRVLFVLFNLETFNQLSLYEIIIALLYGLRFDFSTILIVNAVFIIFSLIPLRFKLYQYLLKFIFVLSNSVAIAINIVDFEFFKFNGKKLTAGIVGIGGDISDQIIQITIYYWPFVLLIIFTFIFYTLAYPELGLKQNPKKIKWWWTPFIGLFGLVITFIGIRGGVQMRSISPKQAYIFKNYEQGHIAINTAYTMIRSFESKKERLVKYYKSDDLAVKKILGKLDYTNSYSGLKKSNIMIIILESFSQEYIDDGFAPFFKDLTKRGLYFEKNLANGRRSIEALPSILVGMPSLIDKPIYQSSYQTNSFKSIAQYLKPLGYTSSFYHGGKTGTMDFDAYTKSIGIEKYFGKEDYPNQEHFDGFWGIYDDKFLNWFGQEISKEQRPFFTTFFSLSSHQPYTLPKEYQNKYKKGSLEIHESIGYVDGALMTFFEEFKNKDWFNNTLFIITADHTQKTKGLKYNNSLGRYRVPLLFYHPKINLTELPNKKTTQHADIIHSVLDFLDIEPKERILYGQSVFSEKPSLVMNYINGSYTLLIGNKLIRENDGRFSTKMYSDDLFHELHAETDPEEEELLKAYIQYTLNGLIRNKLYLNLSFSKQTN